MTKKSWTAAAFCVALIAACGDENTTTVNETTGISQLAKGESLPECTDDNAGEMLFAADSGLVYYCANGKWQTLNGKDGTDGKDGADGKDGVDGSDGSDGTSGKSCEAVALEDGSGYKILCGEDSVGVVKSGADGLDGKSSVDTLIVSDTLVLSKLDTLLLSKIDTVVVLNRDTLVVKDTLVLSKLDTLFVKDTLVISNVDTLVRIDTVLGLNGESCTAQELEDKSGYKILCGNDSVGVVRNGKDGTDGVNGESGSGCTVSDDGNGVVSFECSGMTTVLYKATCGNSPYEPEKSFCYFNGSKDSIITLCNGRAYSFNDSICYKEITFPRVLTKYLNQELLADDVYDTLRDSRDGQYYLTVVIGEQTWMAQNLNYLYMGSEYTDYCSKNSTNPDTCIKRGRYYTWAAANDSAAVFSNARKSCGNGNTCKSTATVRGVCPEGWHLPSSKEWLELRTTVGDLPGTKLKAMRWWTKDYGGTVGTDDYGFSALPAGMKNTQTFEGLANNAYYWSSTDSTTAKAKFAYFDRGQEMKPDSIINKVYGLSIRCLKDSE